MPFPSVTYTFSNGTTADATQVNQDFTDLINGISDGTKNISVSAGTFAGTLTAQGNVSLGNSSANTLTISAALASTLAINTTNSYDIGGSTIGLRSIYLADAAGNARTTRVIGAAVASSWTLTLPTGTGTANQYLSTDGTGVSAWKSFVAPTVQTFTSGSGTYTTPTSPRTPVYLKVRAVGGGGGGGGGSNTGTYQAGGNGGDTTWGGVLTAGKGTGGGSSGTQATGGAGGAASLTTSGTVLQLALIAGGNGGPSKTQLTVDYVIGGYGGNSYFGAGAPGGTGNAAATPAAPANSGAGGGGGGAGSGGTSGQGGGAGAYVEAIFTSPSATYAYAVGAGGSGSGSASFNGSNGGTGIIIVEEYYQ